MSCGVREILIFSDLRIGIRFQQIKLALFCHPVIKAGVTHLEIGNDRCAWKVVRAPYVVRGQFGGTRGYTDFFLIRGIPFNFQGRDVFSTVREFLHHQLPRE